MMTTARTLIARFGQLLTSAKTRALLAVGMVVGIGAVSTMAYWTDSASATGSFTLGSVNLQLNSSDSLSWTITNQSGLSAGSSSADTLTVTNAGGFNFTYNATVRPTMGALTLYLKYHAGFRIYSGATASNSNGVGTCSGGTLIGYMDPANNMASGTKALGTYPTWPTNTGSAMWNSGTTYQWIPVARSLAAGQSEQLCVWSYIDPWSVSGYDANTTVTALATFTASKSS